MAILPLCLHKAHLKQKPGTWRRVEPRMCPDGGSASQRTAMASTTTPVPAMRAVCVNRAQLDGLVQQAVDGHVTFHREIDHAALALGGVVGRGASGTVYKAQFESRTVSAKKYGEENVCWDVKEFWRELAIMSLLDHPNLLKAIGACSKDPQHLFIVTELLPYNLTTLLAQGSLEQRIFVKIAREIISGMQYLHSFALIHRDLKSPNIMLTDKYGVRIIDFGTCRVQDQTRQMTMNIGTTQYMAPELFLNQQYSEKVDVYSFGVVLWELYTRKIPFHDAPTYSIPVAVSQGKRPEIPPDMPQGLKSLIENCWAAAAEKRLSFDEIQDTFATLYPEPDDANVSVPAPLLEINPSSANISSGVLLTRNTASSVFFTAQGGTVTALEVLPQNDATNVKVLWRVKLTEKSFKRAVPIVFNLETSSVIVMVKNILYSLAHSTGEIKWKAVQLLPARTRPSMTVHTGHVLVGANQVVTCYHQGGLVKWSVKLKEKQILTSTIVQLLVKPSPDDLGKAVIFAGTGGTVVSLDFETGNLLGSVSMELKANWGVTLSLHDTTLVAAANGCLALFHFS
eukprot:TRINITY_DN3438_c0_g2_i5.p1 TRINITY_DN3438_c0_g2~~TRINITY_DN3438_c0_g2_i5.p1  ORF type:complete len:568 (-),score=87.57 TRINITY_DN3438_c0_g2_i5:39-1742(-)